MAKNVSTTCGMNSKHLVIIIGIISLILAISCIIIYVNIYIGARQKQQGAEWTPSDEFFAELISIAGMVLFSAKVLACILVIVGGILSSTWCMITFFVTGLIGIILTVSVSVAGLSLAMTLSISLIVLCFTVIDLVCISIVLRASITIRRLKASSLAITPPPTSQNSQLSLTSIEGRPSPPPPYFASYHMPSPLMIPHYTLPPQEISRQHMLPQTEVYNLYPMPRPETPSQFNATALEMTTQSTTQRSELNKCHNIPTVFYNPHVESNQTEEIHQSSNDVDDVSLDEPPRIYFTPLPPTQSICRVNVENPLSKSKVNE